MRKYVGPFLALLLFPLLAMAVQSITFTFTRPAGYTDGTPFGTEQIVYIAFNQTNDAQLFSSVNLSNLRNDIPDGVTCFYARAAVLNVTTNNIVANTLSDPSPPSCKVPTPPPSPKKVGVPGLIVK